MKLILACGGTGGHIFPAVSVAEELRRRDPGVRILYVCGKKDIENAIFKILGGERVLTVESAGFRGMSSLFSPPFLIKLAKGFVFSFRLLKKETPDAVVGFGGHYSFPVVMVAAWLGIPTIVHEQNVMPGVANRFLSRHADGMALSFEETRAYFRKHPRVLVTGNPIRSSIEHDCRQEALKFFGFSDAKRTLLVLGGSQGAESINSVFMDAAGRLSANTKGTLQVLHLCGRMSGKAAEEKYRELGLAARVYSFFDRMELAYSVADVAIGRAGATFLAEIRTKEIPAILIPYPFGGGHQTVNAQVFARERKAEIIPQLELNAEILLKRLDACLVRLAPQDHLKTPPSGDANARELLADFIEGFV